MGHDHSKGKAACPACQAAAKPVQAKVPLKCMVQFRPHGKWKGEFGFDWMRIGDVKDKAYKDIVTTVKSIDEKRSKFESFTGRAKDYDELKQEYQSIPSGVKQETEYFVPWLSLFCQKFAEKQSLPFIARLKVLLTIEMDGIEKIEFSYNKKCFTLSTVSFPLTKHKKREITDNFTITCIGEFDTNEEIKALAFPKGWKTEADAFLAGKIIVCANSLKHIKHRDYVMIPVYTNVTDEGLEMEIKSGDEEKKQLQKVLNHALIIGNFTDGPKLDLTKDINFKITGKSKDRKYGKFVYQDTKPRDGIGWDGGIIEDHEEIMDYLYRAFMMEKRNKEKYGGMIIVFIFADYSHDYVKKTRGGTSGITQMYNKKHHETFQSMIILMENRKDFVLAHEGLHGLGLKHSFDLKITNDTKISDEARQKIETNHSSNPYSFTEGKTDNIMDYEYNIYSTSSWQWKIMRSKTFWLNVDAAFKKLFGY